MLADNALFTEPQFPENDYEDSLQKRRPLAAIQARRELLEVG